jgi:transposase
MKPFHARLHDDVVHAAPLLSPNNSGARWPIDPLPRCGRMVRHISRLPALPASSALSRPTATYPLGQPVTILVERKRFRCRSCARTQFDAIPDLDDKRFATRRLVEFIHQESFRRPFSPIAADIGIDEKTVRNVFEDHAEHLRETIRFETPTWLRIDELKIIGEYRCMITNIEKRAIFDLLPTRRQHDLMPYFRQLPGKDNVE